MKNLFLLLVLLHLNTLSAQDVQIILLEKGYILMENGVEQKFTLKNPSDFTPILAQLRKVPETHLMLEGIEKDIRRSDRTSFLPGLAIVFAETTLLSSVLYLFFNTKRQKHIIIGSAIGTAGTYIIAAKHFVPITDITDRLERAILTYNQVIRDRPLNN